MLDHVTIGVANLETSQTFYDRALFPLGIIRLYAEGESFAGYGAGEKAFFWISQRAGQTGAMHIAFAAANRQDVDQFYEAALAAGGIDHGAPGIRPHYHEHYYGAFVLDPDGHNVEAVCHHPAQG